MTRPITSYNIVRLSASLCPFQQCPLEIGLREQKGWDKGRLMSGCMACSCLASAVERPWLALGGPFLSSLA